MALDDGDEDAAAATSAKERCRVAVERESPGLDVGGPMEGSGGSPDDGGGVVSVAGGTTTPCGWGGAG